MNDDDVAQGLTRQVEVLQRSLGSHRGVELGTEAAFSVIRPVNFSFGSSDVVRVCDGSAGVNVLNLHRRRNTGD